MRAEAIQVNKKGRRSKVPRPVQNLAAMTVVHHAMMTVVMHHVVHVVHVTMMMHAGFRRAAHRKGQTNSKNGKSQFLQHEFLPDVLNT